MVIGGEFQDFPMRIHLPSAKIRPAEEKGEGVLEVRGEDQWSQVQTAISRRARYGMSGTDLAHDPICLPARHAMSSTDMAYRATRRCDSICPRSPLSLPGYRYTPMPSTRSMLQ
eukprot:2195696-Rhodomonas_salina.3